MLVHPFGLQDSFRQVPLICRALQKGKKQTQLCERFAQKTHGWYEVQKTKHTTLPAFQLQTANYSLKNIETANYRFHSLQIAVRPKIWKVVEKSLLPDSMLLPFLRFFVHLSCFAS